MTRVLHVLSTLNIGSGIANFIMNYYRKIDRENIAFDFLVFAYAENNFKNEIEKLGGRIFVIPAPGAKTLFKYSRAVKNFFKEHKGEWDCVHIHEVLVQKFIIGNARRNGVKNIIMHSHAAKFVMHDSRRDKVSDFIYTSLKKARNAVLLSGFKRKTDKFLACSKIAGLALYGKKIVDGKDFFVINNALDASSYDISEDERARIRAEYGAENKKVIIHVGRLCVEKNQTFLTEVFEKVHKADDSYVLWLVGDGEYRTLIENKINALNLGDSVRLFGNRTDVNKLLCSADLFVFPSLAEGLGLALVEAQAAGLECIKSSTVPEAAVLTPFVKSCALGDGAAYWAERILATDTVRHDNASYIKDGGYDLSENIAALQNIYTAK